MLTRYCVVVCLAAALLATGACGKKGGLTLPPPAQQPTTGATP